MKQFLDEKSYRPGYGNFKRTRARVSFVALTVLLGGWVNPWKARDVADAAG